VRDFGQTVQDDLFTVAKQLDKIEAWRRRNPVTDLSHPSRVWILFQRSLAARPDEDKLAAALENKRLRATLARLTRDVEAVLQKATST
jgi:hypothetical protein